jgi:nucleoside-diphosphate-sugar epimerase
MEQRILLAGATGVIGKFLVPLLLAEGYTVYGTTRQPQRAEKLTEMGAIAIIVDVFDRAQLNKAFEQVRPTAVIHQLTDLPVNLDPSLMTEAIARNALIRTDGTRNLVAAAVKVGCSRIVAQSIAWAYEQGVRPYNETQPLDLAAEGNRRVTVQGIVNLEQAVLETPAITGTVLRYGRLYGAGTSSNEPSGECSLHVEAAAWAALLALQHARGGIYNFSELNDDVNSAKAMNELGWKPEMRVS